jgi:hypothetical protein
VLALSEVKAISVFYSIDKIDSSGAWFMDEDLDVP